MKKQLTLFWIFLSLFWGTPTFSDHKEHRLIQLQTQLNQVFENNLVKTLKLTGKKKEKVLSLLKENGKTKALLLDQMWHLRDRLKSLEQNEDKNILELAKTLEKMKKVQRKIDVNEERTLRKLKKILKPKEAATYIVLKHKTMHQLKREVRKRLKDKNNTHKYEPVF